MIISSTVKCECVELCMCCTVLAQMKMFYKKLPGSKSTDCLPKIPHEGYIRMGHFPRTFYVPFSNGSAKNDGTYYCDKMHLSTLQKKFVCFKKMINQKCHYEIFSARTQCGCAGRGLKVYLITDHRVADKQGPSVVDLT